VKWVDLWCSKGRKGICGAVEPQRPILLFQDKHHVTSYGAMFVGEFLLKHYKKFMKNKRN
jgi:hypothetical protein